MNNSSIIRVENVSKKYYIKSKNGIKTINALENISLEISKGNICGFVGLNGAGKSTLIKILSGILYPDSGICYMNSLIPYKNRTRNAQNIGVMFGHRSQLWWDLQLKESFEIIKKIYCVSESEYLEIYEYLVELFDIKEILNQTVRTLSLGQRIRAEFVAVLLHNPPIVILDEPTLGLDIVVKKKIRKALIELNRRYNTTILLTSHDLEEINELCNDLIIIDKGSIIFNSTIDDLKRTYRSICRVKIDVLEFKTSKEALEKIINCIESIINFRIDDFRIAFAFEASKIDINDILETIISNVIVENINILNNSLEEIVENIYAKK